MVQYANRAVLILLLLSPHCPASFAVGFSCQISRSASDQQYIQLIHDIKQFLKSKPTHDTLLSQLASWYTEYRPDQKAMVKALSLKDTLTHMIESETVLQLLEYIDTCSEIELNKLNIKRSEINNIVQLSQFTQTKLPKFKQLLYMDKNCPDIFSIHAEQLTDLIIPYKFSKFKKFV